MLKSYLQVFRDELVLIDGILHRSGESLSVDFRSIETGIEMIKYPTAYIT